MVVHRWCPNYFQDCDHSYDQVADGPARPGSHRQEAVDGRRCIGREEERFEESFRKICSIEFEQIETAIFCSCRTPHMKKYEEEKCEENFYFYFKFEQIASDETAIICRTPLVENQSQSNCYRIGRHPRTAWPTSESPSWGPLAGFPSPRWSVACCSGHWEVI